MSMNSPMTRYYYSVHSTILGYYSVHLISAVILTASRYEAIFPLHVGVVREAPGSIRTTGIWVSAIVSSLRNRGIWVEGAFIEWVWFRRLSKPEPALSAASCVAYSTLVSNA